MAEDEELELVLAISKKTFAEEEKKRAANNDLILLDAVSLQERQRQEQIRAIKRLYSHPSNLNNLDSSVPAQPLYPTPSIGWSPIITTNNPSTHSPFPPQPQFQYPTQLATPAFPLGFISQPHTTLPQSPSSSYGQPLSSTSTAPPPLYPRIKRTSESSSLAPRSPWSPPPPATSSSLSHIPSSSSSNTLPPPLPLRRQNENNPPRVPTLPARLSTVIPVHEPIDYVNELYVPYSMETSSRPVNGDLIDLFDFGGSVATNHEEIWREFDPLYREEPAAPPTLAPPIPTSASTSALDATVTRAKSVVVDRKDIALRNESNRQSLPVRPSSAQDKTADRKPSTVELECLNDFIHRSPYIVQQMEDLSDDSDRPSPPLQFHSAVAEYLTTVVATVQIFVFKDHTFPKSDSPPSITMTCGTDITVVEILNGVLTSLLPEEELDNCDLPVQKYALKIFGLDEILPNDSVFGKHLYVGKSLLQGRDIKLEVGLRERAVNHAEVSRSSYGRISCQITATAIIDPEDIQRVTVHLKEEFRLYEEAVLEDSSLKVAHHVSKIKQFVKLLCTLCANIEPVALHTRLCNYLSCTNPSRLKSYRYDLIAALHGLIHVFCECSMSNHCLLPIRKIADEIRLVDNATERLHVIANSLHNIPDEWSNYREFHITVHFYYGTTAIDAHLSSTGKIIQNDAFFPYIPLNVYASFDRQLCTTPREAKFVFVISGIAACNNNQNGDGMATEEKRFLASTTLPLFDHNSILRQGQFFLSLKRLIDGVLEPWGGMPIIGSNRDPVLIVSLPFHDEHTVRFPDVEVDKEDSPYRHEYHRCTFSSLSQSEQELLLDLLESGHQSLSQDDKELLWQRRHYLCDIPEALPLVLTAVIEWSIAFLPSIYEALEAWTNLPPIIAVQLLLPQFPDRIIREKAVEWISQASEDNSDFIFSFIPQLVEALRFEMFENSALAKLLIDLSYRDGKFAFEIYWQLQQRIDHFCEVNFDFAFRCAQLQRTLLIRHEAGEFGGQVIRQIWLLNELDAIQSELKETDNNDKLMVLRSRLGRIDSDLLQSPVALPIVPSFNCCGIAVQDCGIFNSNAKPLRLVFRGINDTYSIIHKSGDDMRQDALVLHLVNLMNDIWKEHNLDLRMILFRCMPVGYRRGMAELVPDCATLCDIQKTQGLTGVFQDDVLNRWLVKHNSSEFSFKQALDNFQRSCAGWCVATFILGIGDRHNDNILVTTRGHVFHIDFGKYMGDWQMAGGFKRDRVPFVFTPEMYYVVNQGPKQTQHYQVFIDYCTKAFNYLRSKSSTMINLLKIMACSGIPGINMESIAFVENNLMLSMSENEATVQFTQMIQSSLQSAFPRLNFAIHTVAQVFSGGPFSTTDNNKLSFVPQLYSEQTDGRITQVIVIGIEKVTQPYKVYMYKMDIRRANTVVNTIIYRSYTEFNEFYLKLRRKFPAIAFPPLSRGSNMRTNVLAVAQRRLVDIEIFIRFLFDLTPEIKHCDLVYTFFHSLLRDNGGEIIIAEQAEDATPFNNGRTCQLNLKLSYNEAKALLTLFVGHAKNLSEITPGSPPDSYIKVYLRPDKQKLSKRKTQIVKTSCNPTYNAEMKYEHMETKHSLEQRLLEISVWYAGALLDNSKQYAYYLPLKKLAEAPLDRRGNRNLNEWIEMRKSSAGPEDYING